MSHYNITISESARNILHEISQQEKTSIHTILEEAIENYRRQHVLNQTNKAYAKLKQNAQTWEEEIEERRNWENTLTDGLKNE
ncbi:hypothetical protein QUF74_03740 [Candidatus Halobeggiatoa sp. HSG11]|nr:hypothetical protein [Candidatus Halobeggiatoa sp. HSG11]